MIPKVLLEASVESIVTCRLKKIFKYPLLFLVIELKRTPVKLHREWLLTTVLTIGF
uniref:Uncharacterized protein n=1 Tax=Vibrio parahaemolyticus TaxID=670 RepID=A0A7M1WAT6_VIBPH|nr:hypothetical protein VP195_00020 [Vibrio parahaemolyticus]